jgi:hypothetical protein
VIFIMNTLRLRTLAAAVVSASALFGASAHAALTFTGVACSGQGTSMTSQPGYIDCSGAWAGNNLNQYADLSSQILSDWGLNVLGAQDITGGNTGSSGTLNFAAQIGLFAIALKSGDAFSLYEFNGALVSGGISSISFDTLGVGFVSNGKKSQEHFGQGLSHADLYAVSAPVPEPETAALMIVGLGLVGFMARRRKA